MYLIQQPGLAAREHAASQVFVLERLHSTDHQRVVEMVADHGICKQTLRFISIIPRIEDLRVQFYRLLHYRYACTTSFECHKHVIWKMGLKFECK